MEQGVGLLLMNFLAHQEDFNQQHQRIDPCANHVAHVDLVVEVAVVEEVVEDVGQLSQGCQHKKEDEYGSAVWIEI